jgi:hypothetical protein
LAAAPWDIAPIPSRGDPEAAITYAAKGRAISVWEEVEITLSQLYAVLTGSPRLSREACQRYGEPLNFKDRLAGLEEAGARYFVTHYNQGVEGEFAALVERTGRLSVRRNELTHSWVQPIQFGKTHQRLGSGEDQSTTRWRFFLVPPTYTSGKFDAADRPVFIYTSREILGYASQFSGLKSDIERFATALEMPGLRSLL